MPKENIVSQCAGRATIERAPGRSARFAVVACWIVVLASGCGESTEDAMLRAMRRSAGEAVEPAKPPATAIGNTGSGTSPATATATGTVPPEHLADQAPSVAPAAPATESAATAAQPASPYPAPRPLDRRLAGVAPITDRKPADATDPDTAARYYITNLQRVAEALKLYVRQQEKLPFPNIQDPGGRELLSWRVRLLPTLGYDGLYEQFRFDEPWDSPHNLQLLDLIPPEYVNPERFDECTSILAVRGSGRAYDPDVQRHDPANFGDGKDQTLIVVEARADHAVPWTQPSDFLPDGVAVTGHLFVYQDQILGILGSAVPVQLAASDDALLQRALTAAGNDGPGISVFSALTLPERRTAIAADEGRNKGERVRAAEEVGAAGGNGRAHRPVAAPVDSQPRMPVPSDEEIERATAILRDLYAQRIREADALSARRELSREMITEAERMDSDPAGRIALLRAARVLAASSGEFQLAWQASNKIIQSYEVDANRERAAGLQLVHRLVANPHYQSSDVAQFIGQCLEVLHATVKADDYELAGRMIEYLGSAAARSPDAFHPKAHAKLRREVHRARGYYRQISDSLQRLKEDSGDRDAAEQVGRYLCFVKGDWEAGLPMLARGSSPAARVALQETGTSMTSEQVIATAAAWYELGKRSNDSLTRTGALGRSAYWYARAASEQSGSLMQLEARVRLRELEQQDTDLLHSLAALANEHGARVETL